MKKIVRQEVAARIARKVIKDHERRGFKSWAISQMILVRDALEEWEKIRGKQPSVQNTEEK